MLVKDILNITGGKLLSGNPDSTVRPDIISTDSRSIKKGEFFIALKGRNFDGSLFAGDALKKGAIGAMVSGGDIRAVDPEKILIKVDDTLKALHSIAAAHRAKFSIPVIAVTGSNGKTTVKEMMADLLSAKYNVLKNEGTKNNHIGVPLTLLKIDGRHEICVLEIGMNHKGEIRTLCEMVKPDIAVITNIGLSHMEYFKSLDEVFEAKSEIFERMGTKGIVVINGDDAYLSKIKRLKTVVRFGMGNYNDFRAGGISIDEGAISFRLNEGMRVELNLIGVHNVYNALAAIAVSGKLGVRLKSIIDLLREYKPVSMRLNIVDAGGIKVINDAYNSNPLSMKCAIDALVRYPAGSRWVVAGDMLELGERSEELHSAIGRELASSGVHGLLTIGRMSKFMYEAAVRSGIDKSMTWHCESHDEAVSILKKVVKRGDAVLVKGSRGMRMEKVVEKLIAES